MPAHLSLGLRPHWAKGSMWPFRNGHAKLQREEQRAGESCGWAVRKRGGRTREIGRQRPGRLFLNAPSLHWIQRIPADLAIPAQVRPQRFLCPERIPALPCKCFCRKQIFLSKPAIVQRQMMTSLVQK